MNKFKDGQLVILKYGGGNYREKFEDGSVLGFRNNQIVTIVNWRERDKYYRIVDEKDFHGYAVEEALEPVTKETLFELYINERITKRKYDESIRSVVSHDE